MKHSYLIFILAALSMLGALSIDAYLPALPAIGVTFSASAAAVQQTLTAYLLAFAVMTLFYGTLSDSFGRRSVLLTSMVVYVVSSVGAGLAPSLGWLMFFRLLQGLSAGGGSVIGRAVVGDLFSGAEAQRAMASISMVFGLAPAIAPIVGGWLQATLGWRWIFGFIAVFTFLLLVVCWRELPESLPREKRHAFHLRVILVNYLRVGSSWRFLLKGLAGAFAFFGVMLYVGAAPVFVLTLLHLTVTEFAWLFVPIIGGMTVGSWLAARWSHRYTARTLILGGYLTMLAGVAANLVYAACFAPAIPWAVIFLMVYSFGMAVATPSMMVLALEMFPENRGLAASLQSFMFMTVFAIATGLVCPLLFGSVFNLACGMAGGLVLSAGCWWFSVDRSPDFPETESDPMEVVHDL